VADVHEFLKALSIVLGVAAVTTVLFQRLRQPVVLGYILAGLIVGPHVPIPLVADRVTVQTFSELGVILLMFSLGLEFSVRKLVEVGPTAGITAVFETSVMIWIGFVLGRSFGWTPLESIFAGAIVAISSTTIIAKAFGELGVRGRLRDLVFGILIVEDLIAIVLMAILTAVATGAGVSGDALGSTLGRLGAFLAGLLALGMLVVPRAVRYVRHLDRPETLLVACLGLCFGVAYVAQAFGYSVALGAFIAGSLVAESGEAPEVQRLVSPVRDVFAAIFFVSVGMLIDPAVVREHWVAICAFAALVVLGKIFAVTAGAFLTGMGPRTSVQAGMSLAQIGEFSFIIAALGTSLRATGEFLYPIAVTVSALTTLSTPWLIRAAGPAAAYVDRKLPRPLQTVVTLYGSWVEQLRTSPRRHTIGAQVRRLVRVLLLDAALVAGVIIATALALRPAARLFEERLGLPAELAHLAVITIACVAAAPFAVGLVRNGRRLGLTLASAALPAATGAPDLGAAPRRALVSILQFGATLVVVLPIIAVTQPFLPGTPGAVLLGVVLALLGVAFWRSAANLQGHVRAGAQVIVEALAKQGSASGHSHADTLSPVRAMLPGIGEPVGVRLRADSTAVGKTLSALSVRGVTGATVLAISRAGGAVMLPSAQEELRSGDVLALAGTQDSIDAACDLLGGVRLSEAPRARAAPERGRTSRVPE
jgi:CPA2 family monovalent cation:H+ antiporter-2